MVCFSGVLEGVGENILLLFDLDFVLLIERLDFFTLLNILGVLILFFLLPKLFTEIVSIFRLQHSSMSSFLLLRLFKLFYAVVCY